MLKNLALAWPLLVAGCVHVEHIPVDSGFAERVKGKAVVRSTRERTDFYAMTPANPVFGLLGALAGAAAGNDIVLKNGIEDPAGRIAETLSADLATQYGAQPSAGLIPVNTDEVTRLPKGSSEADLLLDVRTLGWGFRYITTQWNRYRVTYRARVRLVDVRNGRVLVEGGCVRVAEESPNAPTYEELLAKGAQRLKTELRMAADYCLAEFRSKTFLVAQQAAPAAETQAPAAEAQPVPAAEAQQPPAASSAAPDHGDRVPHRGRRGRVRDRDGSSAQ